MPVCCNVGETVWTVDLCVCPSPTALPPVTCDIILGGVMARYFYTDIQLHGNTATQTFFNTHNCTAQRMLHKKHRSKNTAQRTLQRTMHREHCTENMAQRMLLIERCTENTTSYQTSISQCHYPAHATALHYYSCTQMGRLVFISNPQKTFLHHHQ